MYLRNSKFLALIGLLVCVAMPAAAGKQAGSQDRVQQQKQLRTHAPGLDQQRIQEQKQIRDPQQIAGEQGKQARSKMQEKDQQQNKNQNQNRVQDGDIYGQNMMTEQERNQYREQLRLLDKQEDKQKFAAQHREKMQARAKAQGITPEEIEEAE